MKAIRFVLATLALMLVADQAHALVDQHTKRYKLEATLLAADEADGVIAYALDSDKFFKRENDSWIPLGVGETDTITTTATLDVEDCGKTLFVTAGIDTKTITLPATGTAGAGCEYRIIYTGADTAALVDISPAAADGIHGQCQDVTTGADDTAQTVVLSGSDDADIGLTKATSSTGDAITLVADGTVGWFASACQGQWANN